MHYKKNQTLNLKWRTSPSLTVYSLLRPLNLYRLSFKLCLWFVFEKFFRNKNKLSARIKPFSKSNELRLLPAVPFAPHPRKSRTDFFSPAVKICFKPEHNCSLLLFRQSSRLDSFKTCKQTGIHLFLLLSTMLRNISAAILPQITTIPDPSDFGKRPWTDLT
jgi:hypothetical protein